LRKLIGDYIITPITTQKIDILVYTLGIFSSKYPLHVSIQESHQDCPSLFLNSFSYTRCPINCVPLPELLYWVSHQHCPFSWTLRNRSCARFYASSTKFCVTSIFFAIMWFIDVSRWLSICLKWLFRVARIFDPDPDFSPGFRLRISGPDFRPGFQSQFSDPDFRPGFPDFRTRISDPDFWPAFLARISDPVFPTRISGPDFSPGFLTRISHPDSRPGFLTRISDPVLEVIRVKNKVCRWLATRFATFYWTTT
jgi:hypothetical protein